MLTITSPKPTNLPHDAVRYFVIERQNGVKKMFVIWHAPSKNLTAKGQVTSCLRDSRVYHVGTDAFLTANEAAARKNNRCTNASRYRVPVNFNWKLAARLEAKI